MKRMLPLMPTQVMGILNVTPDSFSDGGKFMLLDQSFEHALSLLQAGANILDIGGESTRPGAQAVLEDEELARVIPLVKKIRSDQRFEHCLVSVDTVKPAVMSAAIEAGADMINDVNGFEAQGAIEAIANSDVYLCVMHKQGYPQNMQEAPFYQDVVSQVYDYLQERIAILERAHIAKSRLIIDPGFGFGKTVAHNYALLAHLSQFQTLDVPILVGLSRKSMLGAVTGLSVSEREVVSVVANILACQKGANILRVHDVKNMVAALKICEAVENNQEAKL